MKVSEEKKLYGSVSETEICKELADQGIEIDRQSLDFEFPIKELGDFDIPVKLHDDIDASVKVRVVALTMLKMGVWLPTVTRDTLLSSVPVSMTVSPAGR